MFLYLGTYYSWYFFRVLTCKHSRFFLLFFALSFYFLCKIDILYLEIKVHIINFLRSTLCSILFELNSDTFIRLFSKCSSFYLFIAIFIRFSNLKKITGLGLQSIQFMLLSFDIKLRIRVLCYAFFRNFCFFAIEKIGLLFTISFKGFLIRWTKKAQLHMKSRSIKLRKCRPSWRRTLFLFNKIIDCKTWGSILS